MTCERTVCSEMKRRLAISSVPRWSSSRSRTSTSRAESAPAIASGTPEPRPLPTRTWSSSRRATEPDRAASPFATPSRNAAMLLGRLGLQEVAGGAGADRLEEVLLGAGGVRTTTSHSGAASRSRGSAVSPSRPGMERSSRTRSGRSRAASTIACAPSDEQPTTSNPWAREERRERLAGQRVVVDDEDPGSHSCPLSAATLLPTRGRWRRDGRTENQSWLWGRNPARGPPRREPRALPRLPESPHPLRPAGAPARPPDDHGARRPARGGARRGPLLGRGPPGRPAPRERLLRHLALLGGLRDRATLQRPGRSMRPRPGRR